MRETGMGVVDRCLWGQGSVLTGDESANKTAEQQRSRGSCARVMNGEI